MKKLIRKILGKFGYQIRKKGTPTSTKPTPRIFTMHNALARCKERGLGISTVIDVGASDGRWSHECMKLFPDANYLLVEAQEGHKPALEEFKNTQDNVDYVLAAAGAKKGTIYFDAGDLFGGLASETPVEKNGIEVPMVSLDEEIESKDLTGPFLLKLDTHGFEIPILEGAKEIIRNSKLVIIETYNFKLTEDSLRYWEMCEYMEKLGFLPIEQVDFMLRNYDKAFWQMDTFFIPKNHDAFRHNKYD